jgi:hypothetical protein
LHEPEAAGFNGYALLPLVSAILYALAMILTRTKCREENPLVLSLSLNVSFVATGLLATLLMAMVGGPTDEAQGTSFLFGEWSIMGMTKWLTMALLAAAVIIGSVGAAIAYQVGRRQPPGARRSCDSLEEIAATRVKPRSRQLRPDLTAQARSASSSVA